MLSPWRNIEAPSFSPLTSNIHTQVLIIGGGITGLLTAYLFHRQGIPYILVEKDRICSHTTANTTAKITYQHSLIYDSLVKTFGEHKAKAYYLANKEALSQYEKISSNIDCDFETKTNYVYSVSDKKCLEKELSAAQRLGIPMKYTDSVPLPINTVGAVYCENQAQFHPLKFLYAIAKELHIFENTPILKIEGNTAFTERHRIIADNIVFATHFPFIDRHGLYFMKMYQSRSYVIALENAPDVSGMYIDESDKGLSFRNYKNFLFIGGSNHRTGKKSGAYEPLRSFAKKYYPNIKERYNWAAQDCMTLDSAPYIGHYSKHTANWYTATGFNKWGMTGSMAGASLLRDIICGIDNSYAEVFTPLRSIIKPQLFINSAETAINLLTPLPKRCSHLGCALKYNKHEHSWDCPCHGSRFDEKGEVIENPATKNIKLN